MAIEPVRWSAVSMAKYKVVRGGKSPGGWVVEMTEEEKVTGLICFDTQAEAEKEVRRLNDLASAESLLD